MNITHSFSVYFLMISFACNAAEEKPLDYKSIRFNRGAVDKPSSILYRTNKDFIIGGDTGFEIQRVEIKNKRDTWYRPGPNMSFGNWRLLKDDEKIVCFNEKEIVIEDLNRNLSYPRYHSITIGEIKLIQCIALDSAKNTIFIAYNSYAKRNQIKEYNYYSGLSEKFDLGIPSCISMALSSKKDILYLLDCSNTISLRKTNNLGVVLKEISPDDDFNCMLTLKENTLAVSNEKSIFIKNILEDFKDNSFITIKLDKSEKINAIAFHPYGLLAAFITKQDSDDTFIKYWDQEVIDEKICFKEVDTTRLPKISVNDFCFRNDGLALAMVLYNDCIECPISTEVFKKYFMKPLWMKLKHIQTQHNLPQDILVNCMNVLTAYCPKTA